MCCPNGAVFQAAQLSPLDRHCREFVQIICVQNWRMMSWRSAWAVVFLTLAYFIAHVWSSYAVYHHKPISLPNMVYPPVSPLQVEHVLLYDFPRDPIEYMRRVGRTARAGRKGVVTVLAWGRQVWSLGYYTQTIPFTVAAHKLLT